MIVFFNFLILTSFLDKNEEMSHHIKVETFFGLNKIFLKKLGSVAPIQSDDLFLVFTNYFSGIVLISENLFRSIKKRFSDQIPETLCHQHVILKVMDSGSHKENFG